MGRADHVDHARLPPASVNAGSLRLPVRSGTDANTGRRTPYMLVMVEGAFPTFGFLDADQELQGTCLCEAAQLNCTFVIHKWLATIPNLVEKKYGAIIPSMSMSTERLRKSPSRIRTTTAVRPGEVQGA
jgi:ABC-type amino acid transport substrate-binding protein